MRKFYSLFVILLVFVSAHSIAQSTYDSCRADFERVPGTANGLSTGFVALPWDSTTKKPEQICWVFGDNRDTCINYDPAIANNYFVPHIYDHNGAYNVCVRIQYQGGCVAYKCKPIQVGDADSCSIKFETQNSTANTFGKYFIAHPWDAFGKRPLAICWDFGDSHDTCIQYSTVQSTYAVFHSYTHSGSYNVCVKVQFDGGCESHSCSAVQVGDLPDSCSADFQVILNTNALLGRHFYASPWNNHNKKPVQICWNFGDQHDTCIQYSTSYTGGYDVNHVYAQPGSYQVCIGIVYDGGCEAKNCKAIQIAGPDSCSASFDVVSTAANSLGKYFTAKPWNNHDKKPISVCWFFGDNHDTCIQYSTAFSGIFATFHNYAQAGAYNVCVRIAYDGGCVSYYCHEVQVGERDSCSADFQVILNTNTALGRHFYASPWNSNNRKPVKICWNFGDQHDTCIQYSTSYTGGYDVNHVYAQPGSYQVCVGIVYDGGCEAKLCKAIQIEGRDSCSASFDMVSTNANSLGKYFIAKPWNNHNKKPVSICWYFGDNRDTCIQYLTTFTGTYAVFHNYYHAGTYNVCVRIAYDGGCVSYFCHEVQAGERDSCSVSFETLSPSTSALGKYFVPKLWNSNNKKPLLVCWNFGDNHDTCIKYTTTYTGNFTVFHHYDHSGVYNVCVKVTYDGGCQADYCHGVQVGARDSCSVSFETISQTNNTLGKYFLPKLWNSSNRKPLLICWNFGDNRDTCIKYTTTYTGGYAVFHRYDHTGTYNVCVKVTYDGGCVSYYCHEVQAGERDSCSVTFETVSQTNNVLGKYFLPKLWNSGNKKPLLICWSFGDNHDTCIQYTTSYTGGYAVFHRFEHVGNYNVCVKVSYDGGCQSSYCHEVQVSEPDSCKADFEKIATATASDARLVYYRALPWNNHDKKPSQVCWTFGDGKDTCISYPENYTGAYTIGHHYDHAGMYEVCVKIVYYGGCEAKKCKILNIIFYNTQCAVHVYEIVPSVTSLTRGFYFSSQGDARPTRVCWNFGDGTDTCISVDPTATQIPREIKHEYPAPGVYRACVKVLFANGCAASDCIDVSIRSFTDVCGGYYTDSLISASTYVLKGFSIHKPDDAVLSYTWTFGDGSTGSGQTVTHTYSTAGVYRVCLFIKTQNGCETKICNDVRVAGEHEGRLQLSPNPVMNTLHAVFYSTHNETVKIKIISASGAVVKEYTRDAAVGSNTWEFDVSGLVSGAYSFIVLSPNQFASAIFFKF